MKGFTHILTSVFRVAGILSAAAVFVLAVFVVIHALAKPQTAEAAVSSIYPRFCLGGWQYPEHASGPSSVAANSADPSQFTIDNSAYLDPLVGAQMFCGYFTVRQMRNPPKKVTVNFNWLFTFDDTASTTGRRDNDSYTSTSSDQSAISPDTGFTYIASSTSSGGDPPIIDHSGDQHASTTPETDDRRASTTDEHIETPPHTEQPPTEATTTSPTAPGGDVRSDDPASTTPAQTVPEPKPIETTQPQSLNSSHGLLQRLVSMLVDQAVAAEAPPIETGIDLNNNFLDVSYSTDGIHWYSVGKVDRNNWQGYKVEIPVASWDDLSHLQLKISALTSVDNRPNIYLESMSVKVEYQRTIGEAASDSLAAVTDAVDSLLGTDNTPNDTASSTIEVPVPKPTFSTIVHKKLLFSRSDGGGNFNLSDIRIDQGADQSSLTISGSCAKKYYVLLGYRAKSDYSRDRASAIINIAHECVGGRFSYDLSDMRSDVPAGRYYLLYAEQGQEGTWSALSDFVGIDITSSTTVKMVHE